MQLLLRAKQLRMIDSVKPTISFKFSIYSFGSLVLFCQSVTGIHNFVYKIISLKLYGINQRPEQIKSFNSYSNEANTNFFFAKCTATNCMPPVTMEVGKSARKTVTFQWEVDERKKSNDQKGNFFWKEWSAQECTLHWITVIRFCFEFHIISISLECI